MPTQRYQCTRCGHEVLVGNGHDAGLKATSSPQYMTGVCDGCTQQALRDHRLPSSKPQTFRLRS
jgi:DNA-directed RNA polymerase subunit RPC12/RpoP